MNILGSLYTHVRAAVLVAPWVFYLGVADLGLSCLLLLKPFAPDLVNRTSSAIASSVWRWIQLIFVRANNAQIKFHGDALPHNESAIVISNHVSWADFYMIQALAMRSNMLGQCRWFAKKQLRMVPFLGWGLWAMGMPMVSRKWMTDQREMQRVFSGIVDRKWPTWLISFSEATRYTPRKYAESVIWCEQNNRRQPLNLLYPRTRGFIATVQSLRRAPHIKAVYDLTIAYEHRGEFLEAPTMWETLKLKDISNTHGYQFHVMARRYTLEDLPYTADELAIWLEERWIEKGEWLEAMRLHRARLN